MSDVNPYAPPHQSAAAALAPLPIGVDGDPRPWTVGEVLTEAWEVFKRHWLMLLVGLLLLYVFMAAGQLLSAIPAKRLFGPPMSFVGGQMAIDWDAYIKTTLLQTPILLVVQALTLPGFIRMQLQAVRGERVRIETMFGAFKLFPVMLAAMVINMLAVYLGLVLLVVPGVILGYGLCMFMFGIADGDGAIDSLKKSWAWMNGHKARLFLLILACLGLNVVGALACGVGMLVTMPVSLLSAAIVYTRISGRGAPRNWA